ncbi:Elongation factor 1-alpha [Operophtera brumata]|uniref:Elongation factor 1-alpha n=1 Tax=Operophtera brumata TaxID=104452 RepID=A0A0L7LNL6_OPEBR|nr:Elongation factor 1-alpha [Operophtera brumata]
MYQVTNIQLQRHSNTRFKSLSTVTVVTAIDGATLLMLNGFAFIDPSPMPNGERWYCSGRGRWNCSVCLHVNDDYELVCISNEHTHKPPLYEKTAGGLYVEVPRGLTEPRNLGLWLKKTIENTIWLEIYKI